MRICSADERYYDIVNKLYLENKCHKYENGIIIDSNGIDKGYDKEYFNSYVRDNNKGIIVSDLLDLYGYLFFKKELIDGKYYLVIDEFEINNNYSKETVGTSILFLLIHFATGGYFADYLKINVSMFDDDMIKFLEKSGFVISKECGNFYEMTKMVNEKSIDDINSIYKDYYAKKYTK